MKKNTPLALALITLFLFPVIGLAIEPLATTTLTSPAQIVTWIETITKFIFYGVMALAIMFIIIAAFYFLTAAGSPEKIATARQMLIYAIIGVGVALLAYAIPYIVSGILGISTTP
jgi:hypothetical protein